MKKVTNILSKVIAAALALSFIGLTAPAQAAQSGNLTVKIHYQRADNNYTNWADWVFLKDGSGTVGGTGTTAGKPMK